MVFLDQVIALRVVQAGVRHPVPLLLPLLVLIWARNHWRAPGIIGLAWSGTLYKADEVLYGSRSHSNNGPT